MKTYRFATGATAFAPGTSAIHATGSDRADALRRWLESGVRLCLYSHRHGSGYTAPADAVESIVYDHTLDSGRGAWIAVIAWRGEPSHEIRFIDGAEVTNLVREAV